MAHAAVVAVRLLNSALGSDPVKLADIVTACNEVRQVCQKSLADRCLAAKNGGYDALMSALNAVADDKSSPSLAAVLDALGSLVDGNPDVLTEVGLQRLVGLLATTSASPTCETAPTAQVITSLLTVVHRACIQHETNRQTLVRLGLVPAVMLHLKDDTTAADRNLIHAACSVLTALTLDDDIRATFGKSHDHAKMIVFEGDALPVLLKLTKGCLRLCCYGCECHLITILQWIC